jgi:hypothetical protein
VVEKAKGGMESTNCEAVTNASCGLFFGMTIAAEASLSLAPSFFWIRGRWEVFCAMVYFIAMKHAVRRFECVWTLTLTIALAWHAPSMMIVV